MWLHGLPPVGRNCYSQLCAQTRMKPQTMNMRATICMESGHRRARKQSLRKPCPQYGQLQAPRDTSPTVILLRGAACPRRTRGCDKSPSSACRRQGVLRPFSKLHPRIEQRWCVQEVARPRAHLSILARFRAAMNLAPGGGRRSPFPTNARHRNLKRFVFTCH